MGQRWRLGRLFNKGNDKHEATTPLIIFHQWKYRTKREHFHVDSSSARTQTYSISAIPKKCEDRLTKKNQMAHVHMADVLWKYAGKQT